MNKFIKNTYVNREYSWLQFNERVLEEAMAIDNPLLERCKFLAIFSGNLDEFFMVRVGSLINGMHENPNAKENKTGLTPMEQLTGIYKITNKLYMLRMMVAKKLLSELKKEGLHIVSQRLNSKKIGKRFEKYFKNTMLPLLSPMILDNKHPLIHLENLKMYVILHMEANGRKCFGILPVPQNCERIITNKTSSGLQMMTSEDLLYCFAEQVFSKYTILDKSLVRLTRNADVDTEMFSLDFEQEFDFSKLLKGKVKSRSTTPTIRIEMSGESDAIKNFLCKNQNISPCQCFTIRYFFDYKYFFSIDKYLAPEHAERLKYQPLKNRLIPLVKQNSVMASVLSGDLFLSYPFDSMDTLLDLVDEASADPHVVSIKITIYRVDQQSRLIEALRRARRNGKEVTVVMELAARFDEENNLYLSEVFKNAGCTVIYGVGNYKVHSKILLIVLKKGDNISYITHLGTGNYKETTSRQYTDLNIITANREIGEDAVLFFRNISIGDVDFKCSRLLVAPMNLKPVFMEKIKEQIALAETGKPARIICKMNSLTDVDVIKEFVRASTAGVKISLIVRGICCLLPGVPEKTDNIEVKSIIGRFLEHSRIYSFGANDPEIYISSADLMTRNVSRRVEIAAPVIDNKIRKKITKMLDIMLADNEKASYLTASGKYIRKQEPGESSQRYFLNNRA